ncbi:hypothetical protein AcV7_010017 [Taiwanofungus camphoratus]|nr:hypothetical protein AcV7_010017 [Antrodia cinnamomea]
MDDRLSSPLNPSATSTVKPSPYSAIDAPSEPIVGSAHADTAQVPSHRPRGLSTSTIRAVPSSSAAITRVTSNPLPASGSSSIASLGLEGIEGHPSSRSRSSSVGQRNRSASPFRDFALTWRFAPNRAETPPHGAPLSWWNSGEPAHRPWHERKQRTVPIEQTEGWVRTRHRVAEAAANVLGVAGDVVHEALLLSVEVVQFVPIPGLEAAARSLLDIWDALQLVDVNRMACLRLTERCATILLSVREDIAEAGDQVGEELFGPIARLVESFTQVHRLLQKQIHRPFLKRYLRREEIRRSIQGCDNSLTDAIGVFGLAIQIRILKQVLKAEEQRQADTAAMLEHFTHSPPRALLEPSPASANILQLSGTGETPIHSVEQLASASPQQIRAALQAVLSRQNEHDVVYDTADLRQLMRTALQANNDMEMIRVLQVGRDEMPEAIKALQRALEAEVERETVAAEQEEAVLVASASAAASVEGANLSRSATVASEESRKTSSDGSFRSRRTPRDTLDREFIETGIDALRRLSTAEVTLPSWTITRYEVDREEKIGIGFFSDVYKGTWRDRMVAIKVLAPTTPRQLFVHEVTIWKTLQHPNVLELLGASSTTSDPPWFFVSPYLKNGSLVTYLKGLPSVDNVDLLKMIHEIAKGMAYLHGKGVLHGDLKGANVLVDDRGHCVLTDFGQSEMKSEAYRISGTPLPHGTLRWQAPELMAGQSELTQQIDIYAFAICCVEVLTKGGLPWPLADDDAVRHFVLKENLRPTVPHVRVWSLQLAEILASCWHRDPSFRPPFSKIEYDVQELRVHFGADVKDSPLPRIPEELHEPLSTRKSPDMHPIPLPPLPPDTTATFIDDAPMSSDTSYETARGDMSVSVDAPSHTPDPDPITVSPVTIVARSRASSLFTDSQDSRSEGGILTDLPGYESPPPVDDLRAEMRDERRYRMLLQHEFHPSLTLPLWTPSRVPLGAVGYLSKSHGEFVTLFNAFKPVESSGNFALNIPSLYGYGNVSTNSQRQDKRNVAQRGMDLLQSWISRNGSAPSSVSRRYTCPLRAGHKAAHLFTESTTYRYMEDLATARKWFKANVDQILKRYGADHAITREDLYLIIGALEAQDYALFVSHSHPDGQVMFYSFGELGTRRDTASSTHQVNFEVFSAPRSNQPWGRFSVSTDLSSSMIGGPDYHEEPEDSLQSANKVSNTGRGGKWDAVLLARLRFKTDSSEPTSL